MTEPERAQDLSREWAVGDVDPTAVDRIPEPVIVAINLALGAHHGPAVRRRIFSQLDKLHTRGEISWPGSELDEVYEGVLDVGQ